MRSVGRVSFLLWSGVLAGAETSSAALAASMRATGVDARIVFVARPEPLSQRLEDAKVPYSTLGLERGRSVVRHPRALARLAREADTVVSISSGYLAGALRVGGYRGRIVAVEHGAILQLGQLSRARRSIQTLDRYSGVWACAAEIAVSEFVARRLRATRHARKLVVIPNGVDLSHYRPDAVTRRHDSVLLACAARLIPGKGIDDAIRVVSMPELYQARLRIAGDGPERSALEGLAASLGVADRIEFLGSIQDMPAFWQECDIAVVPSNAFVESFGMTAIEAMASGKPTIVSTSGALPEVVGNDGAGTIYEAGDLTALREALVAYIRDPKLRRRHGAAGRRRCEERFRIDDVARQYLALIDDLESNE